MLIKVTVRNFLSIKEEENIKINNHITSIIGKNESGKSTILKAIAKLNGNKINVDEKNTNLKNEPSEIKGFFKVSKAIVDKINDEYRETTNYPFYALPAEHGDLYYSISVEDKDDTRFFSLYFMDDKNKLVSIPNDFAKKRILADVRALKERFDDEGLLDDTSRSLFDDILSADKDVDIRNTIEERLDELNGDVGSRLEEIAKSIRRNYWIELLPRYRFVYFNSFSDVLSDEILLDDLEDNAQAKNILKIGDLDIDDMMRAVESGDEPGIADIEGQYIDVVTRKFCDVFHQTDNDFRLKLRISTGSNKLYFLTYDKTSKNNAIKISDRSDGFRWYLSIYLTLYDYLEGDPDEKYVLLVDEPNLYLHPGAQNDLLRRVFQKELINMQVIYTTHSPYMIDVDNPATIRIMSKDSQSHIYNNSRDFLAANTKCADVDTITPLLTALDLNFSGGLVFDGENDRLIVVEGIQDAYVLRALINCLNRANDFEKVKFIPCYGTEKVGFMFSYLSGLGYDVTVCLDNDKAGRKAMNAIADGDKCFREKFIRQYFKTGIKGDCTLEDLFSDSDRKKFLPAKSTPLYRDLYDESCHDGGLILDDETKSNFSVVLDALLS